MKYKEQFTVYGGDKEQLRFMASVYNRLVLAKFSAQEKMRSKLEGGLISADLILMLSEINEAMLYIDDLRTQWVNPKGICPERLAKYPKSKLWQEYYSLFSIPPSKENAMN